MSAQISTTTINVAKGAQVSAALPETGVVRFAREAGAMAGTPCIDTETGEIVLHFADGASVTLKS